MQLSSSLYFVVLAYPWSGSVHDKTASFIKRSTQWWNKLGTQPIGEVEHDQHRVVLPDFGREVSLSKRGQHSKTAIPWGPVWLAESPTYVAGLRHEVGYDIK